MKQMKMTTSCNWDLKSSMESFTKARLGTKEFEGKEKFETNLPT